MNAGFTASAIPLPDVCWFLQHDCLEVGLFGICHSFRTINKTQRSHWPIVLHKQTPYTSKYSPNFATARYVQDIL